MITATASAIEGPILSVLSGSLGESEMQQLWPWNLVPIQANLLGNGVPRASHDLPGQGLYDCSGGTMPSASMDPRPKTLFFYERSFKKDLGRWGRSIGPEPRAHMGLGI